MRKIKDMRRGSIKLKKIYWETGKSKYLYPRAIQEELIETMRDVYGFGGLKHMLEERIKARRLMKK